MSSSAALPPLNWPRAVDLGIGVQPGAQQKVFRTLVIFGTGAGVGWFEYSGVPGPGNGPIAYASPPGTLTDPFGNALPWTSGGVVATAGGPPPFGFVVMTGATIQFGDSAGLVFNGTIATSADQFVFTSPQLTAGLTSSELTLISGTTPSAFINSPIGVTGASITAFTGANSWAQTAGNVEWGWQVMLDTTLQVTGAVTVPAGFAAGQAMTTAIPAAQRPTNNQRISAVDTTTNLFVSMTLQPSGLLVFQGPVANTAVGNALLIIPARLDLAA